MIKLIIFLFQSTEYCKRQFSTTYDTGDSYRGLFTVTHISTYLILMFTKMCVTQFLTC